MKSQDQPLRGPSLADKWRQRLQPVTVLVDNLPVSEGGEEEEEEEEENVLSRLSGDALSLVLRLLHPLDACRAAGTCSALWRAFLSLPEEYWRAWVDPWRRRTVWTRGHKREEAEVPPLELEHMGRALWRFKAQGLTAPDMVLEGDRSR